MQRLHDVLTNQGGSYILPFFWLHGEDHETLRQEIDKIQACGIREFCVESRPHPDFMGEHWWKDMDMIMKEARRRNMRVWLLDDDKFPTGHGAGGFKKHPEKSKIYVAQRHMDLYGPIQGGAVLVENFLGKDGQLLGIYACPKPDPDLPDVDLDQAVDLSENVCEGIVYLDLPAGYYRLFVLFTTRDGGGRPEYMNLIDSDSVKVLLDQVYEPHYERYKDDFGKTFAGFFSDEPELGNVPGYDFNQQLGQKDVRLPWSRELEILLKDLWGDAYISRLIALWYEAGEATAQIRKDYMDSVSALVSRCFSMQLGSWCKDHDVEYIGHVIEDDNAHARLGCSIAHYFRAESGMAMAGIDVVHLQIIPGFKYCDHQWIASDRDGEFFHFGLGKMGSSLAHLDPGKSGRALCEIFGSFGWAEGTGLMKWLTDHMLVRGINTFVPHAFSPLYPDRDCPPHFYARGNNPQYPYFIELMKYMGRMCHLLNGGHMLTDGAVLYHGEAEWCGKTQLFQRPVRRLMEHQMDCDVVWNDLLVPGTAHFENGRLCIGTQSYGWLVIPGCQCLPGETAEFILRAADAGFPVIFYGNKPEKILSDHITADDIKNCCMKADDDTLFGLVSALCPPNMEILDISGSREDLRACAYAHDGGYVYMFFNEHPNMPVTARIRLKNMAEGLTAVYDGLSNTTGPVRVCDHTLTIHLPAGGSTVVISGADKEDMGNYLAPEIPENLPEANRAEISGPWRIALKETGTDTDFKIVREDTYTLKSINAPGQWPRFSGQIRYNTHFTAEEKALDERWLLALPGISEPATVYINGRETGMVIAPPYVLDVSPYIKKGENDLKIQVVNTLTWRIHDGQSTHMQMNPTGMVKPPVLYKV